MIQPAQNAAIYLRKSTNSKMLQQQSLGDQRTAIARYCEQNGLTIVKEFEDSASGLSFDRSGLEALLAYLESGRASTEGVSHLVLYHTDRLSRAADPDEVAALRLRLKKFVDIHSVENRQVVKRGRNDLATQLVQTINDVSSHEKSRHMGIMSMRGKISSFTNRHSLLTGQIPYGYGRAVYSADGKTLLRKVFYMAGGDKNEFDAAGNFLQKIPAGCGFTRNKNDVVKLIPDPATAPIVKRIFEMALTMGVTEIAKRLNSEGVPPSRIKIGWHIETLHRILRNVVYYGNLIFNKTSAGKIFKTTGTGEAIEQDHNARRLQQNKPEDYFILENAHDGIISKEIFDAVQKRMAINKRENRRPPIKRRGLNKLLRCTCGAKYYLVNNQARTLKNGEHIYSYFCCGNYKVNRQACNSGPINAEILENKIIEIIKSLVSQFQEYSTEIKAELISRVRKLHKNDGNNELQTFLDLKQRELQKILTQIDTDNLDLLNAEITRRKREIAAIENQIATANGKGEGLDATLREIETSFNDFQALTSGIDLVDPETLENFARRAFASLIVDRHNGLLFWKLNPPESIITGSEQNSEYLLFSLDNRNKKNKLYSS